MDDIKKELLKHLVSKLAETAVKPVCITVESEVEDEPATETNPMLAKLKKLAKESK